MNPSQSLWLDLMLNLLSETIGILATVFLVDRLIKRREERRWAPVKNELWANLLVSVDRLLLAFTPSGYTPIMQKCYFDNREVVVARYEYNSRRLLEEILENLINTANATLLLQRIDTYRQEANYFLRMSRFILESELMRQLVEIDRNLQDVTRLLLLEQGGDMQDVSNKVNKEFLEGALESIFALHQWLVQKAVRSHLKIQ